MYVPLYCKIEEKLFLKETFTLPVHGIYYTIEEKPVDVFRERCLIVGVCVACRSRWSRWSYSSAPSPTWCSTWASCRWSSAKWPGSCKGLCKQQPSRLSAWPETSSSPWYILLLSTSLGPALGMWANSTSLGPLWVCGLTAQVWVPSGYVG